jgi:hypothetical protein
VVTMLSVLGVLAVGAALIGGRHRG